MIVYVYEQDLLIRDDIVETLRTVPNLRVEAVCVLLEVIRDIPEDPCVYVLSLSRAEAESHLQNVIKAMPRHAIVLIAGDVPAEVCEGVAVHVPKPFSSDGLIAAVKSVLSAPR